MAKPPINSKRRKHALKILWAVDGYQFSGGGYGFSIHRLKMKEALIAAVVNLCFDPRDDFDLAVHIIRPDRFCPIPGKKNLLFTACEMTAPTVPLSADPDILVAACTHSRSVFSKYYPGLIIEVCPEGIDPALFPFYQRSEPAADEPFRFLFVGNIADTRKGVGFILSAWNSWLRSGRMPRNCQLCIKTTGLPGPELQFYNAVNGAAGVDFSSFPAPTPKLPGIVWDTRNIPVTKLAALYNSAHAFVLVSCG